MLNIYILVLCNILMTCMQFEPVSQLLSSKCMFFVTFLKCLYNSVVFQLINSFIKLYKFSCREMAGIQICRKNSFWLFAYIVPFSFHLVKYELVKDFLTNIWLILTYIYLTFQPKLSPSVGFSDVDSKPAKLEPLSDSEPSSTKPAVSNVKVILMSRSI